jgi:hypothetical protein
MLLDLRIDLHLLFYCSPALRIPEMGSRHELNVAFLEA